MLEYTKTILQKVSFDKSLFQKELRKFRKYIKNKKYCIVKDMIWESPGTLCIYYLIGSWYMKEENILGKA